MILRHDNKSIEFTIDGYQSPKRKSSKKEFDYEANWLICRVIYSDGDNTETFTDPCLLTDELAELAEEIPKVIDGSETCYISDFMEPFLKFAATRVEDRIVIIFYFAYAADGGPWKVRKISALLSPEDAAEIAGELKELVNRYPER